MFNTDDQALSDARSWFQRDIIWGTLIKQFLCKEVERPHLYPQNIKSPALPGLFMFVNVN